jgi:CspA family cold shock protein
MSVVKATLSFFHDFNREKRNINGLIGKISEMRTGIVKFFNDNKGFGFIIDDTTNSEYFVHVTNLEDDIYRGSKVGYDLGTYRGREQALHVKRLTHGPEIGNR